MNRKRRFIVLSLFTFMPGLYVHIPFCARRCPYCDFAIHVGRDTEFQKQYLNALDREIETTLQSAQRPLITSIFFGGGTPTAIGALQLNALLQQITNGSDVVEGCEISLEANPEDIAAWDEAEVAELRQGGWNRISLGVQSFDDVALQTLGRRHRADDIRLAVAKARQAGFDNLSLDLIFAVPGQSRESWQETLRQAVALQPEHVSCYSLTIEPSTAFARRVDRGTLIPLADDMQAALMEDTFQILGEHGLVRYETSNYARAGYECRHNLNYWRGGDYLACGCGAHGHQNGHRWWNKRETGHYIKAMQEKGTARVDEEFLTPRQRFDELVMLGLRLSEGFSLSEVSSRTGLHAASLLEPQLTRLKERRAVIQEDDTIRLAPAAAAVADAVIVQLLT